MNKNINLIIFIITSIPIMAQQPWHNKSLSIDQRVELLLSEMTLEEKVGQLNQYNGFWDVTGPAPKEGTAQEKYDNLKKGLVGSMLNVRGTKDVRAVQEMIVKNSRLGIPLIIGSDVVHGFKTLAPIPLAEAASWDLEAIEKSAAMAAREAAASGINWTFAPNVDISRDARWGRVMEGAGEDPFLGNKIGFARVRGFQGENLANPLTIAACAKHFAGYGFAESGKDYNSVELSNYTLYNVVFPPFQGAIDANVKTVMNAFNTLNGVPATGNEFLMRNILKEKWNFKGFVISDWASIWEMIPHGFSSDLKNTAEKAMIAGVDMDMESYAYIQHLVDLVKEGKVEESLVDDAVRRVLKVKFELGLIDNPYLYLDENREKSEIESEKNKQDALDMAKKSIVLLKNENQILPLKKSGLKIALIGDLADDKTSPLGSWRIGSDDETAVSVLEGMQQYAENQLTFTQGVKFVTNKPDFVQEIEMNLTDKSGFEQAKTLAKNSDVVVMVLGEHGFQSGEGRSRTELGLPGLQLELLKEIYSINKNIVLVLNNGRPLALPWEAEKIPAIVEAWHLGTSSGNAIAQVLYGDYNPSGKLPMTFPRNVGQVPIYYNQLSTGRPKNTDNNVFWSHYIDAEKTPLFPFGFGLSYTTFEYSNLKLNKENYQKGEKITATVQVKNTGKVKGKEVVQLYIRDHVASLVRPIKELKGFEMIELNPNESQTVTFELTETALGFYNNQGEFVVEPGLFSVFVGTNSVETQEVKFELK